MKLIDNRYKVENFIQDGDYYDSYKTIDLWNEDKVQYTKIYNSKVEKELIDYYIENFKILSNIRHESLLSCNKFNLIKSIDVKKINFIQYYTITEYNDDPRLIELISELTLSDRLKILLESILVIDFLHFKGIKYKGLNPYNIFVAEDKNIKIADLSTIKEKQINNHYKKLTTHFISPDYLTNDIDTYYSDYYSIGILAKYLLLEDFLVEDLRKAKYKDEFEITKDQKVEINKIIIQLLTTSEDEDKINLIGIVDRISSLFNLNYNYDIITPRNVLNFQNQIVGRKNDINKIIEIDKKLINRSLDYKGIIIRADEGVGKTRLIDEMIYQLKIRGRNLYSVEIFDDKNIDFSYVSEILKQSIKDAPSNIMEKYRDELSRMLPELRVSVLQTTGPLEKKSEIFRLYNRITNYFNELSKEKTIYIVIDNLHYINDNVLMLLDYLVRNIKSNNIFFIFSFEDYNKFINPSVEKIIKEWIEDGLFKENQLYKLGVQEIAEMLKNILGISYMPINFATALFKEGEGNPKYIEYSIKDLYSINKLYINKRGNWFIDTESYSEIKFAKDMEEALTKQLKIIKEEYYEVFKVMSIFNDVFSKKVLFKMMDEDSIEVGEKLDKLIGLKIVDEKVSDWGYGYSINNSEIKELIYNEISEEEKIKLHSKAADVMSKFIKEDHSSATDEYLLQLNKSNQSSRALSFILKKAKNIQNKYSYNILYLWEKAYEIVKEEVSEAKLDIIEKILNIYYIKSIGNKTEQYLEEYQRESLLLNSYKHIINGKVLLTEEYYRTAKPELGLKEAEEIGKIAEENNIVEGQIISLIVKSRFELRYGEIKDLEPDLKIALELSKSSGLSKHKGTIYNLLGLNENMNGNIEQAIESYKKSVYHHEKDGNYIDATKPINNIGNIYVDEYGDNGRAMEYYEKGLGIAWKYGFRETEMVFLNNISEIYIENYEFDKARKYIEASKKIAIEMQDINIEFLTNINIGRIQLMTGDYKKLYETLYETYKYLQEFHEIKDIVNVELDTQYNNFLGVFYGFFGKWDKSIYHSQIAARMCKKFNNQEYLIAESRIIYMNFFKEGHFNKVDVGEIRKKYEKTKFYNNRRIALLNFATISFMSGDFKYSQELLEEDLEVSKSFTNKNLEDLRKLIILSMKTEKSAIDKIIQLQSKISIKNIYSIGSIINRIIAYKLFENELYEESIKYYLDNLDDIYKVTLKIPDFKLQTSYIKSRYGDKLKENMIYAIKKTFNKEFRYSLIKNIKEEDLYSYFDVTSIFEILSNEEISKIIKLDYYGDAIRINSIEELISNLTGDYKYNLNLIINYISKETLAKVGLILNYDDKSRGFTPAYSIGSDLDYKVNTNILNLASQDKKGLLINNTLKKTRNKRYKQFLTEDIKGIICVPIYALDDNMKNKNERRNYYSEEEKIESYIYLETDKSFNRFDENIFKKLKVLSYLIYSNLENDKLKTIATTDKLTGLYTRKHYELKFEELLNSMKVNDGIMSLIMLDIDNFKNINDSYGHRKGDEVLKLIGSTLKSSVRSSDLVARYGGEEFIILLKNTSKDDAFLIGEKIRHRVEVLEIPGISHPITISSGISLYPSHSKYKEELVEKADQALYYAKDTGKNKVIVWNSKMIGTLNRADKLAGILTGNMNEDNRNILELMDIIELIKKDIHIEDKIFTFLGILLNTIDGEIGTLILKREGQENNLEFSRNRVEDQWVLTPKLNHGIIERVSKIQKGEYLIDWDDTHNLDPLSGIPNWKSVIALPLLKNGDLKGIVYISVPIKLKEFTFDCFNISKNFVDIFSALL